MGRRTFGLLRKTQGRRKGKIGRERTGEEEYRGKKTPFLRAYRTVSPFHLPNFVRLRT